MSGEFGKPIKPLFDKDCKSCGAKVNSSQFVCPTCGVALNGL